MSCLEVGYSLITNTHPQIWLHLNSKTFKNSKQIRRKRTSLKAFLFDKLRCFLYCNQGELTNDGTYNYKWNFTVHNHNRYSSALEFLINLKFKKVYHTFLFNDFLLQQPGLFAQLYRVNLN